MAHDVASPHGSLPPPLPLALDDDGDSWVDAFAYAQWTALLVAGLAAMFLLVHSVTFHRLKRRMADFILCIIGLSDLCFVALEALRHHAHLTYASAYASPADRTRMASPAAVVATTLARFAFLMSLFWVASLSVLMRLGRIESSHVRRNFALSVVAAVGYGALFATLPALVDNGVAHALNAAAALLFQLALLATILVNLDVVRRTTRMNDNTHGRNVLRRLTGYVACHALLTLPFALTQLCRRQYVAFGVVAESLTYLVPLANAFLFGTSLACFCEPPRDALDDDNDDRLMDEKTASGDGGALVGQLAEMVITGPVVKIGEGSSAVVYRTQWLGITVAMKCIRLQGVTEDTEDLYMTHLSELQGTFVDEAALAAQLRHPNITLFIQLGMYKGSMCLVNEYCARGSLRDCLRANPLMEWSTKVRLAFEAAKGLAFMHNRDPIYLHRDLKASNILVTEDWTAKIADFGISRIAPEFIMTTTRRRTLPVDDELAVADRETARHKTSFAGTWRWNAPEIMADPNECIFNRATDMYSFGVSMWEILTNGATPFGDVAFDHQVRSLVANGERPKIPPIYVSRAPPEFVDVLKACWDQDPLRRPTAQDVMLRLGSLSYTLANTAPDGRSVRATSTSRAVFSDNYYHAMDSARSCIIDL